MRIAAMLFAIASTALAQAPEPMPTLPVVDAARELKGDALVHALRKGGYNLYMRHATQFPPKDQEDCNKPALKPQGIEEVEQVSAVLRALKIPVGRVLSSEPCRNRETARRLNLGAVEIAKGLNAGSDTGGVPPFEARRTLLGASPKQGTNTILVSHTHGGRDRAEWMHLELMETIVYSPNSGNPIPVARVRSEAWAALLSAMPPAAR
jgi:phosphohistidine phosphatase SixA